MGGNYEVAYWDYSQGKYISVGYYEDFSEAQEVAEKYAKDWYCVAIYIRTKQD